ncbi:hypothetical protein ACRAJ3_09725 [Rhodococcus pyridinivorans]|uniref:hypothetical protein n=1 Tax=Rhodococcus pyridinivorans TaxID=103816 RepID=UPI003D7FE943
MDTEDIQNLMGAALRKRAAQGGKHLHHRDCIHNLPPEEQITIRGKTVEWWMAMVGSMPEQITPDQWETEPLIEEKS